MKQKYYEKEFKNGVLTYCEPVSLKLIAFIHKDYPQDDEEYKELDELPTRLIAYVSYLYDKGEFGGTYWSDGLNTLYLVDDGKSWDICTQQFNINELDNKTKWYDIPNNERGQLAKGITSIDGEVYAYGMVRSVFKRTGIKEWDNITNTKEYPNLYADIKASKSRLVGDWVGFSALDGFNANDIYAGGNRGDFWHYNGQKWRRVDLPINSDISTITCSKDGKVYVGSRIGSVVIGRDNRWEVIGKAKEITHSCCFDGQTYFSSEDGRIYIYNEKKKDLVEASFKTKYPSYMHHLIRGIASCEECLVIYTAVQAYAYDGEIWHEIIEIPSLSKHK